MRLVVLADNHTMIGPCLRGEPGVAFYMEDAGTKLLLDTGYSDIFLDNARKLGIDLSGLSVIAISHGHDDHVTGLPFLAEQEDLSGVEVVAHPYAFCPKEKDGESIGSGISAEELSGLCRLNLTDKPRKLSKNIWYLGQIPRVHPFENKAPTARYLYEGIWEDDRLLDDTALAYQTSEGFYVITACSHSGICNIIEHAKTICGQEKVLGVIGGLHIFRCDAQLEQTIAYLEKQAPMELIPCHCVSFAAAAAIHARIPIREIGVGSEICW